MTGDLEFVELHALHNKIFIQLHVCFKEAVFNRHLELICVDFWLFIFWEQVLEHEVEKNDIFSSELWQVHVSDSLDDNGVFVKVRLLALNAA